MTHNESCFYLYPEFWDRLQREYSDLYYDLEAAQALCPRPR
jgi:hypothetical protein